MIEAAPTQPPEPEFSRLFDCRQLPDQPRQLEIEASESERAALAQRFGIPGITALSAEINVARRPGDVVAVSGRLQARVERECVVTLEPFECDVEETFELFFGETEAAPADEYLPLEDEDWLEPIQGGRIDLGEAVAQHLSLALDPHPRSPGAAFDAEAAGVGGEDAHDSGENPFKALRDLNVGGGKNK